MSTDHKLSAIGELKSPFTDKFGIPRQANLIRSVTAEIKLRAPYNDPEALRGLEEFSHIWLTFGFHLNAEDKWRPTIRPPRLGGNKRIGVFASRSPFRPNGLGQSLVELHEIKVKNHQATIVISCPDLIDGTPIYDIKPYVQYSDSVEKARSGFAETPPSPTLTIKSTDAFEKELSFHKKNYPSELEALIKEVIAYDPRPAYKKEKADSKLYRLKLFDLDICFSVEGKSALLRGIEKVKTS